MTVDEWLAEWEVSGIELTAIVDRAFDDDRWHWGNDPEAEAIEVDALCALLARDPARVNQPDRHGRRLLHAIVDELGHVDEDRPLDGERLLARLFEACLAHGGDPNATDASGMTPLFFATSPRWIARLIAAGADPNATTPAGATALMHAVQDPGRVRALLNGGADPTRRDLQGRSALEWAQHHDVPGSIEVLASAIRERW